MAKTVLKNRSLALGITAGKSTAAASRNPKNVLSTLLEVSNFYHAGKGFYLGKFVYFLLREWNKKLTDCTRQQLLKIIILIQNTDKKKN